MGKMRRKKPDNKKAYVQKKPLKLESESPRTLQYGRLQRTSIPQSKSMFGLSGQAEGSALPTRH